MFKCTVFLSFCFFFFKEKDNSMLVCRVVCCLPQSDHGIRVCILHQSDCCIRVCILHQLDCCTRVCILLQSDCSIRVCILHQSDCCIRVCILHQSDCGIGVCILHQSDCHIRVCILHQSYHSIWIPCTNHSIWVLFSWKLCYGIKGLCTKNGIYQKVWAHLVNAMVCGLCKILIC